MKDSNSPDVSIDGTSSGDNTSPSDGMSPSGTSYWTPDTNDENPMLIISVTTSEVRRLIQIVIDVKYVSMITVVVGSYTYVSIIFKVHILVRVHLFVV